MEFNQYFVDALKAIGAALCMGLGAIGPALGEGNAVSHALELKVIVWARMSVLTR